MGRCFYPGIFRRSNGHFSRSHCDGSSSWGHDWIGWTRVSTGHRVALARRPPAATGSYAASNWILPCSAGQAGCGRPRWRCHEGWRGSWGAWGADAPRPGLPRQVGQSPSAPQAPETVARPLQRTKIAVSLCSFMSYYPLRMGFNGVSNSLKRPRRAANASTATCAFLHSFGEETIIAGIAFVNARPQTD